MNCIRDVSRLFERIILVLYKCSSWISPSRYSRFCERNNNLYRSINSLAMSTFIQNFKNEYQRLAYLSLEKIRKHWCGLSNLMQVAIELLLPNSFQLLVHYDTKKQDPLQESLTVVGNWNLPIDSHYCLEYLK